MSSSLLLTLLLLVSPGAAEPIRILAIGDSITQGGKRDRPEWTYRYPLQQILHEAGLDFDFIGSRDEGLHPEVEWPVVLPNVPFDPDHESYYGKRTAFVVDRVIENWEKLPAPPDFVLIHLGTNDRGAKDPEGAVYQPLARLIGFLREKNPDVVICLGYLNYNHHDGAFRVSAQLAAVREAFSTGQSPVLGVAHYQDWREDPKDPWGDTFDWAHPNTRGQRKMAEKWYAAIRPFLEARDSRGGK